MKVDLGKCNRNSSIVLACLLALAGFSNVQAQESGSNNSWKSQNYTQTQSTQHQQSSQNQTQNSNSSNSYNSSSDNTRTNAQRNGQSSGLSGLRFPMNSILPMASTGLTLGTIAGTTAMRSLSLGCSPQTNFEAHANNKCPNEWKDYQTDKREQATPQATDPIGLPTVPPEGKNGLMFDDGVGTLTNPVGNMIRTKTMQDQGGAAQQTALSVPAGGPRPVTSSAGGLTTTSMTQPFIRPATFTDSTAERTTLNDRVKRTAAPLGSTIAAAAPASNTEQSPNQLWADLPCTANGASAVMMNAFGDQFLSASTNPAANALKAKADQQIKNMQNSDNQGNCARQNCDSAFKSMIKPLINIANEDAAQACKSDAAHKEDSNVIWMVQQFYKGCMIPMAVLLLLPGAALTQVKAIAVSNWSQASAPDEDSLSPFVGLIRSMLAIFLIPATQLIISYCIDIGNALTEPIAQQIHAEMDLLQNWVKEQAYASEPSNQDNCFTNVSGSNCQGKLSGTPSSAVVQERQSDLSVTIQNTLNTVNAMLSQGLNILNAFQFVTMCYLFLLGPIAAALYAWPASIGNSGQGLFKNAFSNWLDGVIILCLWKFWWCIILLCMVVRLEQGVAPNSQYEMYYYSAFMAILVMVPFAPFDNRPGDVVSSLLDKAQGGGGAGSGAGGSSGGGGKGGSTQGGSSSKRGGSTRPGGQQSSPANPKTSNGSNNQGGASPSQGLPGTNINESGNDPGGSRQSVSLSSNQSMRGANDYFSVNLTTNDVPPPPQNA